MANNEKVLNTRIKLKIATYAEWTDESKALKGANFVLKRGEIGLCEIPAGNTEATTAPTVLFKVGDGTNAFKDLKWASALAADVYGWAKASDVKFENKKLIFVGGGPVDANGQKTDKEIAINFITEAEAKNLFYTKSEVDALIGGVQEAVDAIVIPGPGDFGVLTVDKKAGTAIEVDNADVQNPKVGFKIDATSSNATGGTAVKLSQSNDGLKAEVNLSEYAKTTDLPTDFGVLTLTGDEVVTATPAKGNVVLETKLDNSGNVKFEKTSAGLKGNVDLTHNHDNQYKKLQEVITETGAKDKTVTKVVQNANGEIDVTFESIEIKEEQIKDLHKVEVAEGDYINVVTSSTTNSTSGAVTTTYTVSVDETALSSKIAADTTAAMEFKGATSSLPASANKGDMYKISGEFDVAAANDAQNNGFTAQIGDSIVYDGSKWYLIPSGDDIEDTWRTIQVDGAELPSSNTVNFIGGDHINVVAAVDSSNEDITNVTISLDHDYISGCTYNEDTAIGFDIYRDGVCDGVSTQERLAGMVIEEGTDIEFETEINDNNRLVIAAINHATINATSSNDAATLAHSDTFDAITSIATSSTGHVTEIKTTTFTLPEQYVHPEADVTSTSTNVTLDHGDTFVVKNDTFDELGHITTETTTTYTLPAQYVHPNAANSASSNATTLAHGDSFDVVTESFDAQGHRIGTHTETYTLPELPESIDNAVQTITSNCTAGQETSGLKVTRTENAVNVEIDDAVTFILDCGGAE